MDLRETRPYLSNVFVSMHYFIVTIAVICIKYFSICVLVENITLNSLDCIGRAESKQTNVSGVVGKTISIKCEDVVCNNVGYFVSTPNHSVPLKICVGEHYIADAIHLKYASCTDCRPCQIYDCHINP